MPRVHRTLVVPWEATRLAHDPHVHDEGRNCIFVGPGAGRGACMQCRLNTLSVPPHAAGAGHRSKLLSAGATCVYALRPIEISS